MEKNKGVEEGNKRNRKTKKTSKPKRPSKCKNKLVTSSKLTIPQDTVPIQHGVNDLNHIASNQTEGKTCREFGIFNCICCNYHKSDDNTQLQSSYNKVIEGMTEDKRKQLIKREEKLLIEQQRELLDHSDLDLDNSELYTEIPPGELSQEKQELIEKFINSMAADRIDYEKPKQLNIVNGLSPKRASDVAFKQELNMSPGPGDSKTILQRIDFEKANSEMEFACNASAFKLPEFNATSTPLSSVKVKTKTEVEQNYTENETNLEVSDGSPIPEIDPMSVDRSYITIRTPKSKQKNDNVNEATTSTVSKGLFQERELINQCTSSDVPVIDIENISEDTRERCISSDTPVIDNENVCQDMRERISRYKEATHSLLSSAFDNILTTSDDDTLDFSIIAINETLPSDVQCIINEEPIEILESDPETISIVEICDTQTPSTSTRRPRKRNQPRNQSSKTPRKKRKINCVDLVETKKDESEENTVEKFKALRDCPVCMENLANKEISSTVCGHVYCTQCIKAVVKSKKPCPTCRTALTLKKIHPLFI